MAKSRRPKRAKTVRKRAAPRAQRGGVAALRKENAALREQQAATAEILRVIASSPSDAQPVFEAIVRAAARLAGVTLAGIYRFDRELMHFVAHHGITPEIAAIHERAFPMRPLPGAVSAAARAILERAVVHVPDLFADRSLEGVWPFARAAGFRAAISVPMLRDRRAIGAISIGKAARGDRKSL